MFGNIASIYPLLCSLTLDMTGFALNTHTLSKAVGEAHYHTWGNEDTTPPTKNQVSILTPKTTQESLYY